MVQSEWLAEIENLAVALADADHSTFPSLARRLHMALCNAPSEVVAALGEPCARDRLDALLTGGASREAAFELIGRAQYMLSRGGHQHVIASVVASDLFPETTLGADHEATAFAGALALGLRDWARSDALLASSRATH